MNKLTLALLVCTIVFAGADEQKCSNCRANFNAFRAMIKSGCPNVEEVYGGIKVKVSFCEKKQGVVKECSIFKFNDGPK